MANDEQSNLPNELAWARDRFQSWRNRRLPVLLIRRTVRVLKLIGTGEFTDATETKSIDPRSNPEVTCIYRRGTGPGPSLICLPGL